jgi:hypothetical protein
MSDATRDLERAEQFMADHGFEPWASEIATLIADVRNEALQEAYGTVVGVCALSEDQANMRAEIARELSMLKSRATSQPAS